MMKKLAIATIAATVLVNMVSLPPLRAQTAAAPTNPQGVLKQEPFADVPPDHWAYNAVEFLRQQGLTEGYPDRTYKGKRPMTRYEFAQVIQRMLIGLNTKLAGIQEQVNKAASREVPPATATGVTKEQVEQMIKEAIAGIKPTPPEVTRAEFEALQRLVNEFRDELARLGTDMDAVKRELASLRGRVDAIEAELARMPKVYGNFNTVFKTSWKADSMVGPTGLLRPVLDHDGIPLKNSTNMLSGGVPQPGEPGFGGGKTATVLGYYDLDLAIVARPFADVTVGGVLNVGNYVSSYHNFTPPASHDYTAMGTDTVTPYKVFFNVPFHFLGANSLTVGRFGTQLTPYTFKAIDPDTYTFIPREDSGEVVMWGGQTTFGFGGAKLRTFAGINPLDGRLLSLNVYPQFTGIVGGLANTSSTFAGTVLTNTFGGGARLGSAPIGAISNVLGARLSYGDAEVPQYRATELPVGTAAQLNITPASPATREVAAETTTTTTTTTTTAATATTTTTTTTAAPATVETGVTYGPFRNTVVGLNYLLAAGNRSLLIEDARAQVFGGDINTKIGPVRIQGEAAYGLSDTGNMPRPRALKDWALDFRGFWSIPLGQVADLELGGGWRKIDFDYLVPGYWGVLGSWKNPRGIQGPLAEIRVPIKWSPASFLRNIALKGSAEFYTGANDLATVGAGGGATDPAEKNLNIDRYLAGLQFGLTSRDTVDLGVEQVFRNFLGRATDVPLSLPTGGVGGSPLVGSRIKNTETYINFGIGHNFTPDIAVKLLYQLVDFEKFAVDNSNQPANYRGYVATAQVGVRF